MFLYHDVCLCIFNFKHINMIKESSYQIYVFNLKVKKYFVYIYIWPNLYFYFYIMIRKPLVFKKLNY